MVPEARPSTSPHQAAALIVAALAVGALAQAVSSAAPDEAHHQPGVGPDAGTVHRVDVEPDAGAPESAAARDLREGRAMDVNRASASDLELLPRIGPSLATRIVESRESHGPFASPEDLVRVRGIGPRTVERLRPFVRTSPGSADAGVSAAVATPQHPDG